jgi:hypothetical protein
MCRAEAIALPDHTSPMRVRAVTKLMRVGRTIELYDNSFHLEVHEIVGDEDAA